MGVYHYSFIIAVNADLVTSRPWAEELSNDISFEN